MTVRETMSDAAITSLLPMQLILVAWLFTFSGVYFDRGGADVLMKPTAVITGAAGTLGAATARALASAGSRVVLVDIDGDALERIGGEIDAAGGETMLVVADVSDEDAVRHYARVAHSNGWGPVRQFFNNAGVLGPVVALADYDCASFDLVMAVNVRSMFLGLKHIGARMPPGSTVVNTASTGGLTGASRMAGYVASKHAVIGLTKVAALELAERGVRVNAVCPGPIEGRMIDTIADKLGIEDAGELAARKTAIGRVARVDEIVALIMFLLSPASSYMTGASLPVDGGRTAG